MRDYTEEELKILSDMLPNIALQLRTSLATVYTAVDRLVPADMREKDAKSDRTAAAFYQSYYRLYRVISNLTDAGQLFDRKRFELYDDDIVGVCRSVCGEVDFLFNMQGVTLDFLSDRDSRIIGLDAAAIRKMLLNLLSNALKFTPQGGSVRVRVKTEGRNVKITVTDSGCGMNSDTLAHLFDRFIDGGQDPMPPRGLGLGLPICQRGAVGRGEGLALHGFASGGASRARAPERPRQRLCRRLQPYARGDVRRTFGRGIFTKISGLSDSR